LRVVYRSRWFAFEIPDDWLAAAGVKGFVPYGAAYRARPHSNADLASIALAVDSIGVPPRGAGIPDFDRDRMVGVLSDIALGVALVAIEVTKAEGGGCSHWLNHGRHRLAASIAVGFPRVPAVVVRSLDEIRRAEGVA
jgi:hypothetical protein